MLESSFIFVRYYLVHYNDMTSPLSHTDKITESSRREEDMLREREDASKAYHERELRAPMTAQQRKGGVDFMIRSFHLS